MSNEEAKQYPAERTCREGGYGTPDHSDDPNYQAIYGRADDD